MPDPLVLEHLQDATHRLVRTADAMTEEEWQAPSLLPGWSRSHVVAHIVLNAEGLSGALEGVHEARRTPMYASQEDRDADIEKLSQASPSDLRSRLLASTSVIGAWLGELAENLESHTFERTPGGRAIRAGSVASMRWTEVEVHHADLGLAYTAADWPEAFVVHLLDKAAAAYDAATGFTAHASDLDRDWTFGAGGPTVTGPGSALAWWSTGRGAGEGLSSDDGAIPAIESW